MVLSPHSLGIFIFINIFFNFSLGFPSEFLALHLSHLVVMACAHQPSLCQEALQTMPLTLGSLGNWPELHLLNRVGNALICI